MDRLTNSPIGDCVVVRGHDHRFGEDFEVEAFIPHDLPSTIDLDHETWMAVTRASEQLGRLDAATELIPNPQLISRIATRREAVGTSALEGTYTNLPDLLAAEAIGPSPDNDGGSVPANVREVLNYTAAADAAHEWIRERPISIDMLSNLQAQIVRGTPAEGESGVLRERQVYIGPEDRPITEARFVPPPHGVHLRTMVERWVDWLVNEDVRAHLPAVVRIALAHYQFETLHPYVDGNGRVGRLVIILQLLSEGHLRAPALPVSIWLHRHGDEYRNHLRELSQTGDWSPWVRFFATAVAEQARDGHDKVMQLLTLQRDLSERARAAFPKGRLTIEISESLIAYPILSASASRALHGRTDQANRNAIDQLVEIGSLEPYGERQYGQLYWNPQVFQVLNR